MNILSSLVRLPPLAVLSVACVCFVAVVNLVDAQQTQSGVAEGSARPAQVKVERAKGVGFGSGQKWQSAPRYLQGATIYEPEGKSTHELEFTVIEDGVVLLAAAFTNIGPAKKGWQEGRYTGGTLMRDGWEVILRQMPTTQGDKADSHFVYKRVVQKGQTFKFHTRGDRAPYLIVPAADKVADVLAVRPLAQIEPSGMPRWRTTAISASGKLATKLFEDDGGSGAALVGLKLTHDYASQRRGICSVQPIYEVEGQRRSGKTHGAEGATAVEIQARPGYAVGTVIGSTGGEIDGLRLIFMRRTASGLDTSDTYESRWVGSRVNVSEAMVSGEGRGFRGIRGTMNERLRRLELIPAGE